MSIRIVLVLLLLGLIVAGIVSIQPIKADSKTIVVPDDYPTITAAIGNATEGSTIFVRSGAYQERSLKINKTLALIGENTNNTKINLHPPLVPDFFWGSVYSDL